MENIYYNYENEKINHSIKDLLVLVAHPATHVSIADDRPYPIFMVPPKRLHSLQYLNTTPFLRIQ